jgi:hypothetical protein
MKYLVVLCVFAWTGLTYGQNDTTKLKRKGLYLTWGYTRAFYSKSDIHLVNQSGVGKANNYNFTVHKAVAHDRANFEDIVQFNDFSIPQFVFRIGYQFSEKFGLELNYDHTKYIVDDWQTTSVTGQIDDHRVDDPVMLDPDHFLHFEHSDGANFIMLNLVRQFVLYNPNKNFQASWVLKPGAGVVFPRTDVTLFGTQLNNDWKVAGWIVGVETGLRVQFLRHGFFEFVGKGSFADYVNAFVLGKGHGRASHHFFAAQMTATIGFQFGK